MNISNIVLNNIEKITFLSKVKSNLFEKVSYSYINYKFPFKFIRIKKETIKSSFPTSFFDTIDDVNKFFGDKQYSINNNIVYKNSRIIIRYNSGETDVYYYEEEEYGRKIYNNILDKMREANIKIYNENNLIEE